MPFFPPRKILSCRVAPGGQHPFQLTEGNDVESGTQARQQVQHGDIGTGLHGEADQMLAGLEGLVEGTPLPFYRRA